MSDELQREGDLCRCCKVTPTTPQKERLVLVNGALVCPECDCVDRWPSVRHGEASNS